MLELFRDGIWQAIGAVFSIAAIIASFAIYRWQRQKPALTYVVKSAYPLLKTTEELQGRLSVQVDGAAVRNIDVMFIEFQNSGNRPIARNDFDIPLSIAFQPPVRIISAVVDTESPINLGVNLKVEEQQVVLIPMLLNPGDKLTLKLLLSSDSLRYQIRGRIVGVKQISEAKPSYKSTWLSALALLCIVFGVWLVLYNLPTPPERPERILHSLPVGSLYGIGIVITGYIFLVYVLIFKSGVSRRVSHALKTLLKRDT